MIHLFPSLTFGEIRRLENRTGMLAKMVKGKAVLVPKHPILSLLRLRHGKN